MNALSRSVFQSTVKVIQDSHSKTTSRISFTTFLHTFLLEKPFSNNRQLCYWALVETISMESYVALKVMLLPRKYNALETSVTNYQYTHLFASVYQLSSLLEENTMS